MGAITDLLKSERGIIALALIIASTVLFGTGNLTQEQWTTFAKWVFVTYAAAKTVSGSVALIAARPSADTQIASLIPSVLQYIAKTRDEIREEDNGPDDAAQPVTPPPTPTPSSTVGSTVIPLTPNHKDS